MPRSTSNGEQLPSAMSSGDTNRTFHTGALRGTEAGALGHKRVDGHFEKRRVS